MGDLSNRLPFMSLAQICDDDDSLTFACVWRPWSGTKTVLKLDEATSYGAFASASKGVEFSEGEGVPGRAFKNRGEEYCENLQVASDPRDILAKKAGIKGVFAIFRDGAVWEFGGPIHGAAEEAKRKEFVGTIGGSTGVKKAVNVVLAANRFMKAGAEASHEE